MPATYRYIAGIGLVSLINLGSSNNSGSGGTGAIPTHIVGTLNNISSAVVSTTTATTFRFGITNNTDINQTVNWGYTTL